jgi:hypothetical protein
MKDLSFRKKNQMNEIERLVGNFEDETKKVEKTDENQKNSKKQKNDKN